MWGQGGAGPGLKYILLRDEYVPGSHTVYWFRTETGSVERAKAESFSFVSEHRSTSTPSPTACGRAAPVKNDSNIKINKFNYVDLFLSHLLPVV